MVWNKLLTEDEPSLQAVIKLAQTAEVADAAAKELKEHDKREVIAKIDSTFSRAEAPDDLSPPALNENSCFLLQQDQPRQPRYPRPVAPCAGCRGNHPRQRCPFRDAICRHCNRRGHIAEACRAPLPEESFSTPRPPRFQTQTPQPHENRFPRFSGRKNYSTANRDYSRDCNAQPALMDIQMDLSSQEGSSSDAEPSSSSEVGVVPAQSTQRSGAQTRPQPHCGSTGEPTSTVGSEDSNELCRSERALRRPSRLEDFVTWLS
ncbi:uncharacterized protein [Erythrolamprus reginae]|uniref:uncharacterized protein n=1 Tax=Erythrolamprus reginae TaxID=121349 RepID=UPI00396CC13B